ncbi:(E)-4-hydroxy-3-methylbut-2-enyl-diphosphate synthase [Hyphobacterium sp. CCMP332]|nr:(E)-4-hydroxy-3-methylbut-2-enyl-diphosphate synthase [Hyphobacterium sp. CCMP332]
MISAEIKDLKKYCEDLLSYKRRPTREVMIGNVGIGGSNPIRVQSMTTVDTMDTQGSIEQSIRMIDAGCEIVRITAPSLKDAENLRNIKEGLRKRGYDTPLVADIHFTPNAAELAAKIVEKVRVNPGNYADKKKFEAIEYTDESYKEELQRIRQKFEPLVKICKENNTAMRIGTNHGSLSDRIMSRYGDTPLGMVESALEFIRICEDMDYFDIVISMKASNPQVMVQAYRLLVHKLEEENLQPYPLHLGVTEAGDGEDGRIKSAVGIGTLLEDGLGDTVRVSLTEEPEAEIPVCNRLVDRYLKRPGHAKLPEINLDAYTPFEYRKRNSIEVANFGNKNFPRVVADLSHISDLKMEDLNVIGHHYFSLTDKWNMSDQGADYVYSGKNKIDFMLPNGVREIVDSEIWTSLEDQSTAYPLFDLKDWGNSDAHKHLNFIKISIDDITSEGLEDFLQENVVFMLSAKTNHRYPELRSAFLELQNRNINSPVLIFSDYGALNSEDFRLYSSTDTGGLFVDGFGDGICLNIKALENSRSENLKLAKLANQTAFGVLQATRTRMSKTEYISCPSCGRTLFDLQDTTAMIRKRTDHLKGVKIGIMGCIVNGPGEMADADYGYVGSGKGKITLYKGKEVIKRSVPSENAVDELIEIIKSDGMWREPENQEL